MTTIDEFLEYSAASTEEQIPWGRPLFYSGAAHALFLIAFFALSLYRMSHAPEPVKVLEISVMGAQDLAVKGAGGDFSRGAMPDASVVSAPAKDPAKAVQGTTPRESRSLTAAKSRGAGAAAAPAPPRLSPLGPIFSQARGAAVAAEPGVGREKLYLKSSALKLASAPRPSTIGGGEGLVGVSGAPVDLKSRRGADASANVNGAFLGAGAGSTSGGSELMRRGESIVVHYPTVSDAAVTPRLPTMDMPSSDDFFSIRGPLSHRKILKLKLPRYPRWAEEQGVEAQVSVWLSVTADGRVKSNLYIDQTSGFPAFDQLATEVVQKMLFAPLPDQNSTTEESGVATFNFKLKKASGKKRVDIHMKTSAAILSTGLAVLAAASARAAGTDRAPQGDGLKEIVIEGESRIQMRGDKPSDVPRLDPKDAIQDYLAQKTTLTNPGDRVLANHPILLPTKVDSDIVLSPLRRNLWTPPVLHLSIKNASSNSVDHWRLLITDDRGKAFRTLKGRSHLPEELEWDGLSDSGEPLWVGHTYACALAVLDRGGVPTYLSSKTVKLGSYVSDHRGRVTIELDTPQLFVPGPSLSPTGVARLKEARDWLRKRYNGTLKIDVYDYDADLAQRQADVMRKYLETALHLNEGDISAKGHAPDGDKYLRTEIVAR